MHGAHGHDHGQDHGHQAPEPDAGRAGHAGAHATVHASDHAAAHTAGQPAAHTDRHAGHSVAMFRRKFWVALALTVPTLVWGEMVPGALGFTPPAVPGARWIPVIFGSGVFFFGGWVFLRGAGHELADRRPAMMTLISLAISVAFLFSVAVTFGLLSGMTLWWELASLVTIMLLGHWLEMRSIDQAQGALKALAKLLPDRATRVHGDRLEEVAVAELREGDLVLVRPGASVPADGEVVEGRSEVDESLVTGESRPVPKEAGAGVIAGTVNGAGSLRVTVTRTGDRTALAGIMRLVSQAQASKSRAQVLADRAAFALTFVAVGAAILTAIGWGLADASAAFIVERVVTVLVIACPHALGLAVPLVLAISTTMGAQHGLLVRDRRGLEEARRLTTVVFDKTGTLTLGAHRVVAIRTADGILPDEALRLAAALEHDAEHPVARAIVQSAADRGLAVPAATGFMAIPGHGVQATVEGRALSGGGPNLLRRLGVVPSPQFTEFAAAAATRGEGLVHLVEGTRILAAFSVADAVRPESAEAVRTLHDRGVEVAMLTGDAQAVADALAATLGIDTVFAQVLPAEKVGHIRALQAGGKRVAMVGDGINDAAALAASDCGIAVGAGTDVAVEAGDIVLVRSDPRDVPRIITLSAATYRRMVQNLWWAAGYNIVAIPLAAGVLMRWGVVLSPAVGAVLMSASTVIVAVNAQLLRRTRL